MSRRFLSACVCITGLVFGSGLSAVSAQQLFVGLETSSPPPTRTTDLTGFPNVTWQDHFSFEVSGAAATPEGTLYLCNGPFTTRLYESTLAGPPQLLATISEDMSALAFGRGTLWGYSNYADPKGIYAIDPATGEATLVLDVHTGTSYRFFALDYNPVDDKLYGYTEYGTTGLYRIDIDTGEMTFIVGRIPAANGQGRALAVGNHTVYLTATRGDENIPCFAYDLAQGVGGQWIGFTNPYPTYHSTGGAAWIPDPTADVGAQAPPGEGARLHLAAPRPNPASGGTWISFILAAAQPTRVEILDPSGRWMATLAEGPLPAGRHALRWDACDAHGRPLSPGVYLARVTSAGQTAVRTVTLVR